MSFLRFPLVLITLFLSFSSALFAQNTAALQKAVSDLATEHAMRHATLAVSVYKVDKGTQLYAHNSQTALVPASLVKLFTTSAGFDRLGAQFRFCTTLAYSGDIDKNGTLHGSIYIIGGGDPLLGSYRYRQTQPDSLFAIWHQALVAAGIKAVDGRVHYDASIFDNHPINNNWPWGDIGNYYGCGASGLNFHENMFFIYLNPGAKVGFPASLSRTAPAGLNLRIINEAVTGQPKSGDNIIVYGDPGSSLRTCTGTLPVDARNFSVRASLPKPAQACADLFTVYLRQHKLHVSGAASEALQRPRNLISLLEYTSPAYTLIAQYTNMTSNNIYAESIHRFLGYKMNGLGSNANGNKAVADYIKRLNLEASGIVLDDGCGLSMHNRLTADFLCRFLCEVAKTNYFNDFLKSLPSAGESGTVKKMLTGLPPKVSVSMKSGSMTGVRSFAGYVTNAKGDRYCFAVIANNYDCTGAQMRAKLEKIILKIATLE